MERRAPFCIGSMAVFQPITPDMKTIFKAHRKTIPTFQTVSQDQTCISCQQPKFYFLTEIASQNFISFCFVLVNCLKSSYIASKSMFIMKSPPERRVQTSEDVQHARPFWILKTKGMNIHFWCHRSHSRVWIAHLNKQAQTDLRQTSIALHPMMWRLSVHTTYALWNSTLWKSLFPKRPHWCDLQGTCHIPTNVWHVCKFHLHRFSL